LHNLEIQMLKKMDSFGKKEILLLQRGQAGSDNVIFTSKAKENFLDFSSLKNMVISIKREVDRWLSKLEAGQIPIEPGTDAIMIKPKPQDITNDGGGPMDSGSSKSGLEMAYALISLMGQRGKKINGKGKINIGLKKGESNTNICKEDQSLSKNG
jgi:hypothetical protein